MRVPSVTWYLCVAAACNVTFNPEWVSSPSVFNFQRSCLWSEFFLHMMGFPPPCSLSRSNHPARMLSGLTEQLLALSNQVKWPSLHADLQLDTSVCSLPVHFADTILWADASKQNASLPSQSWSSLCHPPDCSIHLCQINSWCCCTKVNEILWLKDTTLA